MKNRIDAIFLLTVVFFLCLITSCSKKEDQKASTNINSSSSTITSFSPTYLRHGSAAFPHQSYFTPEITISGTNFSNNPNDNVVMIGNVKALINSAKATTTTLVIRAPEFDDNKKVIKSGKIRITVAGKTIVSASNFIIVPGEFEANDYVQVVRFLEAPSANPGLSNAEQLNFDINDPLSWHGFVFDYYDSRPYQLQGVRLIDKSLAGDLVLKNCKKLEYVSVSNNQLTSLDLTGTSGSIYLDCEKNNLRIINITHPLLVGDLESIKLKMKNILVKSFIQDDIKNNKAYSINPQNNGFAVTPSVIPSP